MQCGGQFRCRPTGQQRSCCDDHLSPANTPRSSSVTAAAMQVYAPRWDRSATPMTTPCARASSPPSNASFSIAAGSRHKSRRAIRHSRSSKASTIGAAAIPRSDILHRSDCERRHHALAVDPDAHQPAIVLATVKDKPSGRPQDAAVLDLHCARRPHHRAGRDGRMAPPGAEPKNGSTQEGNMPSNQIS